MANVVRRSSSPQGNWNNRVALFCIALFAVRFCFPTKKEVAFDKPLWGIPASRGRAAKTRSADDVYSELSWDPLHDDNVRKHAFPKWEDEKGIELAPILNFMRGAIQHETAIFNHSQLFPETPYVVNDKGVWTSSSVIQRVDDVQRIERWEPSHKLAMLAWTILKNKEGARWPALRKAVNSGGFPYVAWYGDNRKCSHSNWKNNSIPVFTTCARLDCHSTFPIPTYKTIRDSKVKTSEWKQDLALRNAKYPWESKVRKVVWRGSLWLNGYYSSTVASPRWKLSKMAKEHPSVNYDFGLVQVAEKQVNLEEVGGLVDPIPMEDFQQYVGVLDVDGTSWSSRFGTLLCYNSVVLKVEPEYVDYFHFDLKPWKHYIPVKRDLSNLAEAAAFVADSQNDQRIKQIVEAANEWCHTRMTASMLGEDILHIWEAYVEELNKNNPNWMEVWHNQKSTIKVDMLLE